MKRYQTTLAHFLLFFAFTGMLIGNTACSKFFYSKQTAVNEQEAHPQEAHPSLGIIKSLQAEDIQFVRYGNLFTLIIPTDDYFVFNTTEFVEEHEDELKQIAVLLQQYPQSRIVIAGFTDNVGSVEQNRRLSQHRAEKMLAFLWANGISEERLHAVGYGRQHTIANNKTVTGSAMNRRLEIQWWVSAQHERL